MAERHINDGTAEHYSETEDPHNPPNAVINPQVRRGAWWLYVFPLIVVALVAGMALLYWVRHDVTPQDDPNRPLGTSGEQLDEKINQQEDPDKGGRDPRGPAKSTQDEIEFRN